MSTSRLVRILLFFILFFSVNCTCNFRYSTKDHPCNTKATLLPCNKFTHAKIEKDSWSYYFISLAGIKDPIELEFKIEGIVLYAYVLFQDSDQYFLPNRSANDNVFVVNENNNVISLEIPSDINGGWLAIGLQNPTLWDVSADIRYFMNGGNCKCPLSAMTVMLLISLSITTSLTLFVGVFSLLKLRQIRQRIANGTLSVRRDVPETELDAEVWPQDLSPIQEEAKQDDPLTLKEIEKYFPKRGFQTLKSPFQQTMCLICLEEFDLETESCQLFCKHIFHEGCIQKWLKKQNNCPGCRSSITKDTIKEFLETQGNELLTNQEN